MKDKTIYGIYYVNDIVGNTVHFINTESGNSGFVDKNTFKQMIKIQKDIDVLESQP